MRFAIVVSLALCCAAPAPKWEDIPSTAPGALIVTVYWTDYSTARSGIDVEVSNGTAMVTTGKTNSCGVVLIDALPDGVYSVTARQDAATKTAEQVAIKTGADTKVRIDLPAAPKPSAGGTSCTPPMIVSGPNPAPSVEAFQQRRQGCLVIKCRIGADGLVGACQPVEPLTGYTEDVIATVQQRRYQPMLCDGKPVETDYTIRTFIRLPRMR